MNLRRRIERLEKRAGEDHRCPVCGGKRPIEWPDVVLLAGEAPTAPRLCRCDPPPLHPTVARVLEAYEARQRTPGD